MFRFLKSCKVKNKALNEIEANLKIAVEHLDQGQEYYLPVIYQCLVSPIQFYGMVYLLE